MGPSGSGFLIPLAPGSGHLLVPGSLGSGVEDSCWAWGSRCSGVGEGTSSQAHREVLAKVLTVAGHLLWSYV